MPAHFSGRPWPAKHEVYRWKEGMALPHSAKDLVDFYGSQFTLMLCSGRTPAELARELETRGVISSFKLDEHIPKTLAGNEMWGILGVTYGQWCGWWSKYKSTLAVSPEGFATSKAARWHRASLFQIRVVIPRSCKLDEPVYHPSTLQAFWEHIRAAAERIIHEWSPKKVAKKPEKLVGWPIGVPQDYTALYREHRVYVERILNHYYKPSATQSFEDVKQHIWVKLCEAQVIEKFVKKAKYRKLPATLTATEAVEYLRITWDQWMDLMRKDLKWLQPTDGNNFASGAIFSATQVRNVEEAGIFPLQDTIPAEDMAKVFRGYLKMVIHNHFANYCRTRKRRFILENTLPEGARIRGDGSVGSALEGDQTPWEDCLEAPEDWSPEACLDRPEVDSLGELDVDLSEQIVRINKAVPGHRDEVINLIAEGYTLREAITKVRFQVQDKLRVHSG